MEFVHNIVASITKERKKYSNVFDDLNDNTLVELGEVEVSSSTWIDKYVGQPNPVIGVDGPFHVPICEGGYFIHAGAHYLFARDVLSPLYANLLEGTYPLPLRCNDWVEATETHLMSNPGTFHVVVRDNSPIMKWASDKLFSVITKKDLSFDDLSNLFGICYVPTEVVSFFCSEKEGIWFRVPLWVYITWYAATHSVK